MASSKIVLTPKAEEDLQEIYLYLFDYSPNAAVAQIERILDKIELLEQFPQLGQVIPDFENENLRELKIGNYLIAYYIVSDKQIDILTVHRSSRP